MKRFGKTALAAVIAATTTVQVAHAQLPGIPYGPVSTGLGINLAADYGKPTSGGGSAVGVTGGLGISNLGISASVGAQKDSSGHSQTTLGGRVGLKLFGGGLTPVTVGAQVGAGYVGSYTIGVTSYKSTTIVSPGVWARVSPPLFPLKPWGQAYYAIRNQPFNPTSTTKSELRFTVGADFNLLLGLGVHAAYDWGDKGGKVWGVGAHLNLRVPSLGVPGVPGI